MIDVQLEEYLDEIARDVQNGLVSDDTLSMIETVAYHHYVENRVPFGPHNSCCNMTALLKDLKQLDSVYFESKLFELTVKML